MLSLHQYLFCGVKGKNRDLIGRVVKEENHLSQTYGTQNLPYLFQLSLFQMKIEKTLPPHYCLL